ncbi:MAG: DUF547 domain-containing protein [Thermoleophilia bacterium]
MIESVYEKAVSDDGRNVDYASLGTTMEFQNYILQSRQLAGLDPATLDSREAQLAFWINLYNILAIHCVDLPGVSSSVSEESGFFDHQACSIGGLDYSLNDIEYGILRGNARKSNRVWKQFRKWDPRVRLSLDPPEPRVCFALVRAARSSPPLRFYQAEQIEGQLHRAAVDFIGNGGVIIDRKQGTMSMSRIFRSYSRDFGGDQGVMRFIADHLESPDDAGCLRSRAGKLKVQFQEFNWALNGAI